MAFELLEIEGEQELTKRKDSYIGGHYQPHSAVTLFQGDRLQLLEEIPDKTARLIVTSPPYNIGKKYEKRLGFDEYLKLQRDTLTECARILAANGSLCWQVGNHIGKDGEVFPLDIFIYGICKELGLKLRNRIVWCFEHGLHCRKRLSGRYETILWFTKSDNYIFNLDAIRVPQKAGQYSCNPLGKNPGDLWTIPNVKHNHVEKTIHPCQFPIELVERLVLALTNSGDLVVDPYIGAGSAACAAVLHGRRAAGADTAANYLNVAKERIKRALEGELRRRPLGRPIYQPSPGDRIAQRPAQLAPAKSIQAPLFATA